MTDVYIEGFCKTAEEHGVDPEKLAKYIKTAAPHASLLKLLTQVAKSGKVTRRLGLALSGVGGKPGSGIARANKALDTFAKMPQASGHGDLSYGSLTYADPVQRVLRRFSVGTPGSGIQVTLPVPKPTERVEALSRVASMVKAIRDKGYRFNSIGDVARPRKYVDPKTFSWKVDNYSDIVNPSWEWLRNALKARHVELPK